MSDFSNLVGRRFTSHYDPAQVIEVLAAYIDRGEVKLVVADIGGPTYTTNPESLRYAEG